MKNFIIYILTGFFLFFVAGSTIVSNNDIINSHQVVNHTTKSHENSQKSSITQIVDSTSRSNLELAEYNFQMSDTLEGILFFASVFGLILAFGLLFKKRLKSIICDLVSNIHSVKKFILIRSIRI